MNRLVRKWLKAGALEEGELVTAEKNCSDECTNLSHYRVSGWDKLPESKRPVDMATDREDGSPVRESRTPGSVRVLSNEHPYRDKFFKYSRPTMQSKPNRKSTF